MKQLLLTLLVLFGFAPVGRAQFIFQKAIGTGNGAESSSQMIALRGGGYLLAGTRIGPYLARVNEQGDTLWTRDYKNAYSTTDFHDWINRVDGISVAENRSGRILFTCGGTRRRANGSADSGGLLLMLDGTTGNITWSQTIQSPLLDGYNSVALGNDGNFVLVGWQLGSAMALKMDSTGRILWSTSLPGVDSLNTGPSLITRIPGGYLVSNREPAAPGYRNNTLHFLSETGQDVRQKPTPLPDYSIRCVWDPRGGILFANGNLSRLTAQGDTLWHKRYTKAGFYVQIRAVAITPDSNYIVLGERDYQVQQDLVILKIAPNGQVIRDTVLYRPTGNEYASDILVDAQGNYTICGWTSSGLFPMGFPDIILAKYRGWSQTLQAPAELAAVPAQPDVFPNPTTGRVTLRAAQPLTGQLVVRDVLGRVLLRQPVLGTPSVSCSLADWPPGLYLLTFAEPNRTRTWRVVKEQEK